MVWLVRIYEVGDVNRVLSLIMGICFAVSFVSSQYYAGCEGAYLSALDSAIRPLKNRHSVKFSTKATEPATPI